MLHFTTRPWHLLWHRGRLSLLAALVLSLTVSGCSSIPFFGNDDDEEVDIEAIDTTEERVYSQAQRALRSSNFSVAIEQLELLEARFPFGRFAEQAQLELIYAHYLTQDMDSARANADRFIRLHPNHPNVDYAYYMKGLSAYTGNEDVFNRFLPHDPTQRDTSQAKEAFAEFAQLVSRFPDSPYAADARAVARSWADCWSLSTSNFVRYPGRRSNTPAMASGPASVASRST